MGHRSRMILWRFSVREIWSRKGRAALTTLSVVLGVASLVAVWLATGAARTAYKDLFAARAGKADLVVSADAESRFDQAVVPDLEQVEVEAKDGKKVRAFSAVVPSLQESARMYGTDAAGKTIQATVRVMGVDPDREHLVREYDLASGEYFSKDGQAVLDAGFAKNIGLAVGQKFRLGTTKMGRQEFEVAGTVKLKGAAGIAQAGIIFVPLKQAQKMFGAKGKIDAVHLVFAKGFDKHAAQASATAVLTTDLTIGPPASGSQTAEESMLSPETGLFLASTMSMMVSAFIILNTFFINVSERRRQLAILRAIGATRRQIMELLMTEGFVLGTFGTILGMGAGIAGAYFLTRAMEGLFQTTLPAVQFAWSPFLLAGLFGIGISLIATLLPAWFAGQVSPLEGMGGMLNTDTKQKKDNYVWWGIGMIAVGGTMLALVVYDQVPRPILNLVAFLFEIFGQGQSIGPEIVISLIGTIMQMIGAVMVLRALLGPLVSGVSVLLSPFMRVEAKLGRQQLLRRRTRTALTIGVLFMAVSTGVGMGNTLLDNVQDVKSWYKKSIIGDFFVRVMMPDQIIGETADIPDGVRESIERIPGVKRIGSAKFVPADVIAPGQAKPQRIMVIARDFKVHEEAKLDLKDVDAKTARGNLLAGEVIISTVLSQRTGLVTGDKITLEARGGPTEVKIGGMANDYIVSGLIIYMNRDKAVDLFGIEGDNALVIDAEAGRKADVGVALKEICADNGVLLQSQAEINEMIDGMMSGVIACQWVILVIGFCVAAFGIVNTLIMNVLEQTRELGLLRIVAMTRWQVRWLILGQAAMIGIIGLLPGVFMGLGMAWFINISTLAVTGHPIEFVVRPLLLAGSFAAGLSIVIIAAMIPAERAAKLNLATALQYE